MKSSLSNRSHQECSPAGAGEGGAEEMSVTGHHRKHTPGGRAPTAQVGLKPSAGSDSGLSRLLTLKPAVFVQRGAGVVPAGAGGFVPAVLSEVSGERTPRPGCGRREEGLVSVPAGEPRPEDQEPGKSFTQLHRLFF